MARVKRSVVARKRHKKILDLAKGYYGRSKSCFRVAVEKVEKALRYAYRDRRNKKRDLRGLWIQRINAATRQHGMSYSVFMHGLSKAGITINRKMLSEIAINDSVAFANLVEQAKSCQV